MNSFNIRVYGIFINNKKEVLLTDEYRLGTYMTKFPGGGLEIGEGTIDCLVRECREELGQEVTVLRHFYTTDFFQATRLLPEPQQLISIYYLIDIKEPFAFRITQDKFNFPPIEGRQSFRFMSLHELSTEDLTFPIDKLVLEKLKNE